MSEACTVCLEEPDGTVLFIKIRYDGCREETGAYLVVYYSEESRIRELLDLGDQAFLLPSPKRSYDPNHRDEPRFTNTRERCFSEKYCYVWVAARKKWVWRSRYLLGWYALAQDEVVLKAARDIARSSSLGGF